MYDLYGWNHEWNLDASNANDYFGLYYKTNRPYYRMGWQMQVIMAHIFINHLHLLDDICVIRSRSRYYKYITRSYNYSLDCCNIYISCISD